MEVTQYIYIYIYIYICPDRYKRFVECLKSHFMLAAPYYDHRMESSYKHSLPDCSCLSLSFGTVALKLLEEAVAMKNDKT